MRPLALPLVALFFGTTAPAVPGDILFSRSPEAPAGVRTEHGLRTRFVDVASDRTWLASQGRPVAAGICFIRMTADDFEATRRVVRLR